MDFQRMLAQYQSEYASKKSELEKKLEGIRQQAKDRADHLLQRDKQGASLFAQKQSIETRINERGYQLVESDPVGNELLTKGQKLQEELSTLDKKGLDDIFKWGVPDQVNPQMLGRELSGGSEQPLSMTALNTSRAFASGTQHQVIQPRCVTGATGSSLLLGSLDSGPQAADNTAMIKQPNSDGKISQKKFKQIQRVYTHAILKKGIVYLRSCRRCGVNAPVHTRPTKPIPHFLKGDYGLMAHMQNGHKDTGLGVDSIGQYCTLQEMSWEDAILMSEGKVPPKKIVITVPECGKRDGFSMFYEDFKKKASHWDDEEDSSSEASPVRPASSEQPPNGVVAPITLQAGRSSTQRIFDPFARSQNSGLLHDGEKEPHRISVGSSFQPDGLLKHPRTSNGEQSITTEGPDDDSNTEKPRRKRFRSSKAMDSTRSSLQLGLGSCDEDDEEDLDFVGPRES